MKKIFAVLIVLLLILVAADYLGFLGVKTKKVLAFSEITLKPVNSETGEPIFGARAVCFRHRNHEACTLKESDIKRAVKNVTVMFPVHKIQKNTWLFSKGEEPILPADPAIKIMLIHGDYEKVTNDFSMIDIHTNPGQEVTIEMKPGLWTNTETEEE